MFGQHGMMIGEPVSGSWSVLDVPGLQAWYDLSDASSVTLDVSNKIASVADKSGYANTAISRADGVYFNYDKTGLGMASGVGFNAASASALNLSTSFTSKKAFAVADFSPTGVVTSRNPGLFGGNGTSVGFEVIRSALPYALQTNWGTLTINGTQGATGAIAVSPPIPMSVLETDSSGGKPVSVLMNRYLGNTRPWVGRAGEFIFFDRTPSAEDQVLIRNYLKAKWGVA